MLKLMLACCKVYISESRNKAALEAIERAAKLFPEAPIINKFEDEIYNRVGYTLVSRMAVNSSYDSLKGAVFAMVEAAFESIDFGAHSGSHPRLGVVDHICFHPLGSTSLEQVAGTANSLAADVGSHLTGLFSSSSDFTLANLNFKNLVGFNLLFYLDDNQIISFINVKFFIVKCQPQLW